MKRRTKIFTALALLFPGSCVQAVVFLLAYRMMKRKGRGEVK